MNFYFLPSTVVQSIPQWNVPWISHTLSGNRLHLAYRKVLADNFIFIFHLVFFGFVSFSSLLISFYFGVSISLVSNFKSWLVDGPVWSALFTEVFSCTPRFLSSSSSECIAMFHRRPTSLSSSSMLPLLLPSGLYVSLHPSIRVYLCIYVSADWSQLVVESSQCRSSTNFSRLRHKL